jgi:type I restriction enzyme S subunit
MMAATKNILAKFGILDIPDGWQIKKLKDILIEERLGGNYENAEANNGIPVIKMGNLDRATIKIDKIKYLPENEIYNDEDVLVKGDLLFNTRNTLELVGKVAIWNNELPFAVYNSNLMRMKFDSLFVESTWFMNRAFNSYYGLRQLRGIATGTTSVAAIYGRDLESIKFLLPPLPEQKAIAQVLSTADAAIHTTEKLISQKILRKKWLMQQLLTGKKRLMGFEGEWKEMHIRDVAKEVSIRNKSDKQLTVLSCTKYDGLVPSLEYFGRKIFADDVSTYKIVPKNHFAYATNHIEEGSIGYQKILDEALISPMYTVFKTDNTVNDDFFYKLLKSHPLVYQYQNRMEGSIDRRGGLRWDGFSIIKIKLPSIEEQTAIAQVLQVADREISLLKAKAEKLNEQKKGLMQVLLTGKVRLKISNI